MTQGAADRWRSPYYFSGSSAKRPRKPVAGVVELGGIEPAPGEGQRRVAEAAARLGTG